VFISTFRLETRMKQQNYALMCLVLLFLDVLL
jgi:hypothetical protein